jgi:hypothetical protein
MSSSYFPILVTLAAADHLPDMISGSPILIELQKIYSTNILGITAGLTLMISLLNNQQKAA